jgi:hypothetical protein
MGRGGNWAPTGFRVELRSSLRETLRLALCGNSLTNKNLRGRLSGLRRTRQWAMRAASVRLSLPTMKAAISWPSGSLVKPSVAHPLMFSDHGFDLGMMNIGATTNDEVDTGKTSSASSRFPSMPILEMGQRAAAYVSLANLLALGSVLLPRDRSRKRLWRTRMVLPSSLRTSASFPPQRTTDQLRIRDGRAR